MAARSLNGRPRRRHRRRRNHKERARIASSRIDESDRVLGLELDADDYLVKPYSFRELLARLKVVLRRTRRSSRTRPQPDLALTRRSDVDPKRPRLILTVRGEGYRFTERVSWTSSSD
jgi:DNA-binding response OmpR family regulator